MKTQKTHIVGFCFIVVSIICLMSGIFSAQRALGATGWDAYSYGEYCECGWEDECEGENSGSCSGLCVGLCSSCGTTQVRYHPFSDCVSGDKPGYCGEGTEVRCKTTTECCCFVALCGTSGTVPDTDLKHDCITD